MGLKDLFAAHATDTSAKGEQHEVKVLGMHFNACEQLVSAALEERGATDVHADHESGRVTYYGDLDAAAISEAVTSAGFQLD